MIVGGSGQLRLDALTAPIAAGTVISRPAGIGTSHRLESGDDGLAYLLFRRPHPGEITYLPDSDRLHIRALNASIPLTAMDSATGQAD